MASGWRVETRRVQKRWIKTFRPDDMPQDEFRSWIQTVLTRGPSDSDTVITPGYFFVYEGALIKVFYYTLHHNPPNPGTVAVAQILPVLHP